MQRSFLFHYMSLRTAVVAFFLTVLWTLGLAAESQEFSAWQQSLQFTPTEDNTFEHLGSSVALSDEYMLIGEYWDDVHGESSGSAYLFDAETQEQLLKLTPEDGHAYAYFGNAVALYGDYALIGAYEERVRVGQSGCAYLFDLKTGKQLFRFIATDDPSEQGDGFGQSVALYGDYALVGTGDSFTVDSWGAFLFDVNTGELIRKFSIPQGGGSIGKTHGFGKAVALYENYALIGAYADDEEADDAGSAYLFDVTTGEQLHKFTASDAQINDSFGKSVALSEQYAIIGAPDGLDGSGSYGKVYTFDLQSKQRVSLLIPDNEVENFYAFGQSTSLDGKYVLIGAWREVNRYMTTGCAYLFDVTTGQQICRMVVPERFSGVSKVALQGRKALLVDVNASYLFELDAATPP